MKKLPMDPGEVVSLAYLPDGKFLVGEQGVDTFGNAQGRTLDRHRLVIVQCEALRSPVGPGAQYRPHTRGDRVDAARRDAAAVARWHVDPNRAHLGSRDAVAITVPDDSPAVALSARARRSISRVIRGALDNLPAVFLSDRPTMVFNPVDGTFIGYGIIPDEPADHYLVVKIGPDDDVDDVDGFLDRVRVRPSGVVEVVSS